MDEVDGMAGNEDRGGLQELVSLIKHTEVPIICICNDRYNTKVKTISIHSYDLKFSKLRVEQIRVRSTQICFLSHAIICYFSPPPAEFHVVIVLQREHQDLEGGSRPSDRIDESRYSTSDKSPGVPQGSNGSDRSDREEALEQRLQARPIRRRQNDIQR